jgi:hypothetical protein
MNITDIRQHVTHFSEELRHKAKHEEEVVVGGEITNIIPPVSEDFPLYTVMVDDKVGTVHIMVSDTMISAYSDKFQTGSYIFLEGFANVISHIEYRQQRKDVIIFAYNVKDITIIGDSSQ